MAELLEQTFFVMQRGADYRVLPQRHTPEGEMPEYDVRVVEEAAYFVLLVGHLVQNRYLECSSLSTAYDYNTASYELYRPFAQAIRRDLEQIGYLYSAEALRLGATGIFYTLTMESLFISPDRAWTYKDVEAIRLDEAAIPPHATRLDLYASWTVLEKMGYSPPRDDVGRPMLPSKPPGDPESEEDDLSFFRTRVDSEEFSSLTMPRTFFARTEIHYTRFRDTDLSQSFMCWNDWLDCDFTAADLSSANLKAARYLYCTFAGANLNGADLRMADFIGCDFTGAQMQRARLTRKQAKSLALTAEQRKVIAWQSREGPEPAFG
jgi:hypothetical protein